MLLFLLWDNGILSKPLIQHPAVSFSICGSLRYQLFWNLCFLLYILNLCLSRRSIALICAQLSAQCLEYPIQLTKNSWCSIDNHFHDRVTSMLCTVLPEKAAITPYMNHWHKATLRLPKMQHQEMLTLHWHWFSGWHEVHVTIVFGPKGCQHLPNRCLQPITT